MAKPASTRIFTVANQKGEVVAMFRGKSAQIPGTVFPEEAPQ